MKDAYALSIVGCFIFCQQFSQLLFHFFQIGWSWIGVKFVAQIPQPPKSLTDKSGDSVAIRLVRLNQSTCPATQHSKILCGLYFKFGTTIFYSKMNWNRGSSHWRWRLHWLCHYCSWVFLSINEGFVMIKSPVYRHCYINLAKFTSACLLHC